jgi:hypothetical protein
MAWNTPTTVVFKEKLTSAKVNEIINDLRHLKGLDGVIDLDNAIRFSGSNGPKIQTFRKTGIVAVNQVLLPAGSVTEQCWIGGSLTDGTNAFVTTAQSMRPNTLNVAWYTDGGANIVQLNVFSNGEVNIVRGAGSRTYAALLFVMWF